MRNGTTAGAMAGTMADGALTPRLCPRLWRSGAAGLALLLALGGAAQATDPSGAPTTTEDFIRALIPQDAPAGPSNADAPRTRGLSLGTGDATEATPPAPPATITTVRPAAPPAAQAPMTAPAPAPVQAQAQPPAQPPAAAPRISFQVEFAFNSAELTPTATGILNELGRALTSPELSAYRFQLTGHTDGVGKPDYNLALSKRRAASVGAYLTRTFGVAPGRLVAVGRGAQQLLNPADPASAVNRRVEIINLGS